MLDHVQRAQIEADAAQFQATYDCEPFAYAHTLHQSGLFDMEEIRALAERHSADDYFVAASAPTFGTRFYDVPHSQLHPRDALSDIENGAYRVILKRPERYDKRYRDLLETLFAQVKELRGWPAGERVVRLDAAILVNSAAAITPLHFDPEVSFFFQIAGHKSYHLFDPASMSEPELERFYVRGKLDISQVDAARCDAVREYTFELLPGMGMHQPQNTPHWVQTREGVSISYVFSIETETSRRLGRTRGFNCVQRRLGFMPAAPGAHPRTDAVKAEAMRLAFVTRDLLAPAVRAARKR
jgi:hypothetical protein